MSSLPDGVNGVSGIGVLCPWSPPLSASDLDSQCLALCVGFIVLNVVVLAVVEVRYWEVQRGTWVVSHFAFSLEESQGPSAEPALSQ